MRNPLFGPCGNSAPSVPAAQVPEERARCARVRAQDAETARKSGPLSRYRREDPVRDVRAATRRPPVDLGLNGTRRTSAAGNGRSCRCDIRCTSDASTQRSRRHFLRGSRHTPPGGSASDAPGSSPGDDRRGSRPRVGDAPRGRQCTRRLPPTSSNRRDSWCRAVRPPCGAYGRSPPLRGRGPASAPRLPPGDSASSSLRMSDCGDSRCIAPR